MKIKYSVCAVLLVVVCAVDAAARCKQTDPEAQVLDECFRPYFSDFDNLILREGNDNTCIKRTDVIKAKNADVADLIEKAKTAFNNGECGTEVSIDKDAATGNTETDTARLQSVYSQSDVTMGRKDYTLIITNGIPDHCYHDGHDQKNPNPASENYRALFVPKVQKIARRAGEFGKGPVGIATSGGFLFSVTSAEPSCKSAAITEKPGFDACDGHADAVGRYHYHLSPNPKCYTDYKPCMLIGYMQDGLPIYSKCSVQLNGEKTTMTSCYQKKKGTSGCDPSHFRHNSDKEGCNLDVANGYNFPSDTQVYDANGVVSSRTIPAGYAYFFTDEYPYTAIKRAGVAATWCGINVQ